MAEMGSVGQCGLASGGYRVDSKAAEYLQNGAKGGKYMLGEVTVHFGRIQQSVENMIKYGKEDRRYSQKSSKR